METRKIGSLDVSIVGIGCNNFGMRIDADATKAVRSAFPPRRAARETRGAKRGATSDKTRC